MNTKFLSYFAAASVISALLGIVFHGLELALFGTAVSALVLLIAATDYAPRRTYSGLLCPTGAGTERHPLAA